MKKISDEEMNAVTNYLDALAQKKAQELVTTREKSLEDEVTALHVQINRLTERIRTLEAIFKDVQELITDNLD